MNQLSGSQPKSATQLRLRHIILLALLTMFSSKSTAHAVEIPTGYLNRQVAVGPNNYRYVVYVPADWSHSKKWPVILFLHGSGERGQDGLGHTEYGLPSAIRKHMDRYPAVVVMPQCRSGYQWEAPAMEAQAFAALDACMKDYNGDATRLYLTGISMGGFGTWSFAAKFPDKFAAIVPICGGLRQTRGSVAPAADPLSDPSAEEARKLGHTPVWTFHGDADDRVPVAGTRRLVEALKAAGGDVKYTEYPGIGHDSWTKAYDEPELPIWLFSQHLPGKPSKSGVSNNPYRRKF